MTTPRRFNLTGKPEATILILLLLVISCLAAGALAQSPALPASQNACGATFAGSWQTQQNSNDLWTITVKGGTAEGIYSPVGVQRRILRGKITGNLFAGEWNEIQGPQSGNFVANLVPPEHRIQVTFYSKGDQVDTMAWFCELPGGPVGTTTTPPRQPATVGDDHDTDNFATFDSLPTAQQETVLIRRGPRLPKVYQANDFEMRVFVQGGAPLVIDYELDSDAPAYLNISVRDLKPLVVWLEPAQPTQQTIVLPDHFGPEPQIAKVHLAALTRNKQPAKFRLYGLAMGRVGAQALNKLISPHPYVELAMTGQSFAPAHRYEPLPLFASNPPQAGTAIEITVSPPTTIKTGQKPKEEFAFSFMPHSLFDNGNWELLLLNGLSEGHVWKKKIGPIRPNNTVSGKWDGKLTWLSIPRPGDYSLKVTAWRGDASRAFVIARATENLVVIR